ncbi:MAG: hypothetical protein GF347_01300 [Candidatus Moranbacteria bacterium]|nr:hypothetical protein [Candidatus Moranbacteria bacterium]
MNVVLVGFDNSNKDKVAEILAHKLKYDTLIFNNLIVSISGRTSMLEIMKKDGELARSRLETQILSEIELKGNYVIATSENIIFNQINILTLKKKARTIYLKDYESPDSNSNILLKEQKINRLKDDLFKYYSDAYIEIQGDTPTIISENIYDFLKNSTSSKII